MLIQRSSELNVNLNATTDANEGFEPSPFESSNGKTGFHLACERYYMLPNHTKINCKIKMNKINCKIRNKCKISIKIYYKIMTQCSPENYVSGRIR